MQCVWAMVICFYTITTKCNDALNTFYCHSDSVRHDMTWLLHADAAHACQPNRTASGRLKALWHQLHQCSSSEQWQCASILSIPCRMSHQHQTRLIAILTTLDTKWWLNVLLPPSLNLNSVTPGHQWGCIAPLLSMPLIWSVTMCFYTITIKFNGPLNTFYCRSHNVRHELVFWRTVAGKPKFNGLFFLLWDGLHMPVWSQFSWAAALTAHLICYWLQDSSNLPP